MGQEHVANKVRGSMERPCTNMRALLGARAVVSDVVRAFLISQFGIDRVAREPGSPMPHYANRLGKASDLSGLGLLKELAVISELKIGASTQSGLRMTSLMRDAAKLTLLRSEFQVQYPENNAPLAYLCVLNNHGRKQFNPATLEQYCEAEAPGVKLLAEPIPGRPPISPDRLITRL